MPQGAEVETVRGRIAAGGLGVTLMHEHVFVLSPEIMANHPEGWGDEQAREDTRSTSSTHSRPSGWTPSWIPP
jgi:predicted metal-dependent phosphotriesterase family hydrolase